MQVDTNELPNLIFGNSSPVPYFYPGYLFTLLIWRERRDEARCGEKYREVWQEYCKGCTLAKIFWNLLDELSVLDPLSE
jgi:hypothetical protein